MDQMVSIDRLELQFAELTGAMSRLDALRLHIIRQLDIAQVASADGARSMIEWLAGRFDLEVSTARTLLGMARAGHEELEAGLESGEVTVDRAAAIARLKAAGASERTVAESWGRDLAGVAQVTASHRRISSREESDTHQDRYLHMQPSLDESCWKLWGQLTGVDGRIVDKAIHTALDALPNDAGTTAAQDRADGLVSVASEWLSGEIGGHDLHAEIFIDGTLGLAGNGEAGASILAGPRVGPATLAEILCAGTVAVNFTDTGRVVSTTPGTRAVSSGVRRRIMFRDGHRCVIAGCQSRTRLQIHHVIPFSEGGSHDLVNLVTVCWFHHHVVIHQQGMRLDPHSPPQARRFLRADPNRAGPSTA